MALETTYSALRQKLAAYLDHVTDDREVVIVRRRGARDVALVPAEELASLTETAHLLRSPRNAERLRQALAESIEIDRQGIPPDSAATSIEEFRNSLGVGLRAESQR